MNKLYRWIGILASVMILLLPFGDTQAQTEVAVPLFSDFAWNMIGDPEVEENASYRQFTWTISSSFPEAVAQ